MERTERKLSDLELELMSTDWILEKVKDDTYAQNLYAALCNNQFVKNEVFPILKEDYWHCSWRYAGGIIADMRNEGDYLDWYCTGIRGGPQEDFNLEKLYDAKDYVGEGVVTDEIRKDLFILGWVVVDSDK
jgi:hypothetical protein